MNNGFVGFPGLGLEPFEISRIAFRLGPLTVNWYGLIITVGIVLAVLYVMLRAAERGVKTDDILDLALFTVISGVIGARLYYVLTNLSDPTYHNFWNWFKIWKGGLGIYGGIIAGGLAVFLVLKFKKISFPMMADCICPAVLIGQILGRWGNFFNREAYGSQTTLPWGMALDKAGALVVHPTFLYESLWNLLGFLLINIFFKKRKYDGEVFLFTFGWYGFGRMLIELLRSDSLYISSYHAWFTKISVLVGFFFFVVCATLLVWHRITDTDFLFRKNQTLPATLETHTVKTRRGILGMTIGIAAIEAAFLLFIVLSSVFYNL